MNLRILVALATAGLIVASSAAAQSAWRHDPARDHVGRIYHYVRSNTDGTELERVRVFRSAPGEIAVNKEVSRCTNSAYVTAELDLAVGEARRLIGGRLTRTGTQEPFAWLEVDPDTNTLATLIRTPDGEMEDEVRATARPVVLFDFDFADLTVLAPHYVTPREGFSFGMALFWPPAAPDILVDKGAFRAVFQGEDRRLGRSALRFRVEGQALAGKTGLLWLDAAEGHLLEATLPIPNHDNYADFRIVLEKVEDTGAEGWRRVLMSHWEGCPPA